MSLLKILRLSEHARLGAGKFSVKVQNLLLTDEKGNTYVANIKVNFNLSRKNARQARMYFSSVGHTTGTLDFIIKRSVKMWAERHVLQNMSTPPEAEMRRINGPIAQDCERYGIIVGKITVHISPTTE